MNGSRGAERTWARRFKTAKSIQIHCQVINQFDRNVNLNIVEKIKALTRTIFGNKRKTLKGMQVTKISET
jgi:hypothetical protein